MNQDYNNHEKQESRFKNEKNAQQNFDYFKKFKDQLKPYINYKIHNYRLEHLTDAKGQIHTIEQILDPMYAMLSWKDAKGNYHAFPISFHIEPYDFEKALRPFIFIPKKINYSNYLNK